MTNVSRRQTALRGFGWGAIAGLALVALMYLANLLLGLQPLPQLLNQPLLSLMPGFVFGFLIDTLQHAGKVVEEFGLMTRVWSSRVMASGNFCWIRRSCASSR